MPYLNKADKARNAREYKQRRKAQGKPMKPPAAVRRNQPSNALIEVTPATRKFRQEAIEALREEYRLPTPRPVRLDAGDRGYSGSLRPRGF